MNKRTVIVLVEDEPIELMLLSQILGENSECEIHQALNADEGLALCERVSPDIIISDYHMPGGTGYDFCKKIKQNPVYQKVCFIMLTGIHDVDKIVGALDIGADDYLTKPYHAQELRSRVNAFVRIRKLQERIDDDNVRLERLCSDLKESFDGVVELFCDLMEMRVPSAAFRGARAIRIMGWMSKMLPIPEDQIEHLHYAALLHEIGKISLPDTLLNRNPVELTKQERIELENYPLRGQLLTRDIPVLRPVASILRHQMENYDGTGYPDRLQREEIPVGSRILRIINAIESILQNSTCTIQQIEEELMAKKGILYDPQFLIPVIEYLRSEGRDIEADDILRISVPELKPGMRIARHVYTSSGKKLLAKDSMITEETIGHINRHHQKDPILVGIYVHKSDGTL